MIYSGVGSRKTPDWCLQVMEQTAFNLAEEGYLLRSGGANGADTAFENGCDVCPSGKKVIYTAWQGITNKRLRAGLSASDDVVGFDDRDLQVIEPVLKCLGRDISKYGFAAKALQCRNVRIVLGLEGEEPTNVVVAWTPAGELVGGTATAIMLAELNGIKVINLGIDRCGVEELTESIVAMENING